MYINIIIIIMNGEFSWYRVTIADWPYDPLVCMRQNSTAWVFAVERGLTRGLEELTWRSTTMVSLFSPLLLPLFRYILFTTSDQIGLVRTQVFTWNTVSYSIATFIYYNSTCVPRVLRVPFTTCVCTQRTTQFSTFSNSWITVVYKIKHFFSLPHFYIIFKCILAQWTWKSHSNFFVEAFSRYHC